ncbi:MAG: hypothetical protein MUF76_04105 [Hydrogenophaga sp.]|nr:hypothetical protein [Hydrogenophaga sp.]
MALQFDTLEHLAQGDIPDALGGACLGRPAARQRPCSTWPVQQVRAPLLGGSAEVLHEVWRASPGLVGGHTTGIHWCRSGDVLYGTIELEERDWAGSGACSALEAASEAAYTRIFRLLDAQGLPHLWRAWNYVRDIHGDEAGLERYRRFNLGRARAFEGAARSVVGRVPAACALGLGEGPLSVAFLAGTTPAVPIENPRQVSAYLYPVDYGPRSPTFSRAALVHPDGQEWLFVSGTASIVGHRSMHLGDVVAQTHESLDNIAAVLAEANRQCRSAPFALEGLSYRVYVRHPRDADAVMVVVRQRCGTAPVVCLQADVCRMDLLVEIEAQAGHTARAPFTEGNPP